MRFVKSQAFNECGKNSLKSIGVTKSISYFYTGKFSCARANYIHHTNSSKLRVRSLDHLLVFIIIQFLRLEHQTKLGLCNLKLGT